MVLIYFDPSVTMVESWLSQIEEWFSETHSVHFNPFLDNHVFVFIAFYEKFFDYVLILNC